MSGESNTVAASAAGPDPVSAMRDIDCELVIGLVGAVGTDLGRVRELLQKQLRQIGYEVNYVKVSSDVISLFGTVEYDAQDHFDRISKYMTAGNSARKTTNCNSVLALGVAANIAAKRKPKGEISPRTATIVDSLKRPEEVERLRQVYPGGFVLLGVHAEEQRRHEALLEFGISSENADRLIRRDADEVLEPNGQRLQRTFYLSDFFVHLDGSDDRLKCELRRIVELLFGNPFRTPEFDEYAMFFAFSAALRSADLSRQVGAVIARNNQILATGANDCPRAGGGLYWPMRDGKGCLCDEPDGRDYKLGVDSNRNEQSRMIDRIVNIGVAKGLDGKLLRDVLSSKGSPINDITEYGRVVHAEMDALTACARSHLSTDGATLYCTTFPCHNCAKHIVAAGIKRVVYIEPYEKSKAPEFHQDSIVFDSNVPKDGKVRFEPFVGIGPRKFFDLFSMNLSSGYHIERKERDGTVKCWANESARLRLQMLPSSYLELETNATGWFQQFLPKEKE